ncbi:hypothetical protein KR032_003210, partial [Drosophila birchii]
FPRTKCSLNYLRESAWEPQYLKNKCKELGIEKEFNIYLIRLFRSYVSVFFVLHIVVTIIHCIMIMTLSEQMQYIYFDMGIFAGCCVLVILILSINFCKTLIEKHPWLMFVSSALACLTLVSADLIQNIYHHYVHDWQIGTIYNTYILFMIYTFLPILSIRAAVLLAVVVSFAYITYFGAIVYRKNKRLILMSNDFALYLSINVVGILFRIVNDMVVRSSFIDRHQFIQEELNLRNAQRHEKELLDSILPTQFSELLQKDIKNRIIQSQRFSPTPIHVFTAFNSSMAIQLHSDVSILYADVVNYTHLTTTLTVEKLVTTLHDLYARFDRAAKRYNVQRIKFLGDCYYCVAGLSNPDPDHANNAVALGIAMIAHIQEVRNSQELDINMRIGVHSGSLFAGVIGKVKLQYDVWGTDVTIANVLESTGVPGCVHISEALLNNLHKTDIYTIESGPEQAQNNSLLQKHRITTHLIVPSTHSDFDFDIDTRDDLKSFYNLSKVSSYLVRSLSTMVNEELREEYRNMPVIQFDPLLLCSQRQGQLKNSLTGQMNMWLTYHDPNLEKPYLKQRDYFSKYYMLLAWVVGLGEIYIQIMGAEEICIWCIILDCFVALFLTVVTFMSWYKKICWMRYDRKNEPHNYNRISCTIFRIHEKMQKSLYLRVCTFLIIIFMHWLVIGISMLSCDHADFILNYIEERIYHFESNTNTCFDPWDATSMIALMTCLAFTFVHIPFLLKTFVALAQVLVYYVFVFFQYDFVFHHSTTTNPYLPSEYAHALIVLVTFFTMFLKAKQTEFYKKINFSWRVELEKKKDVAAITHRSIWILLNNILPSHVVDIYLNTIAKDELYYENYKMVSVMFAMLSNFQMDISSLRILNDVIGQFDELLLLYKNYVVEKIKIANCTYIAACGLDVTIAGSTSAPLGPGSLKDDQILQLVTNEDCDEVVYVMASFALDLMRTLASCNKAYNRIIKGYDIIDAMITIGISSGEIMAGIVGASKPHYDIWGDPVNMAARMEMTGLAGHIQVTEESANILQTFGIQCNYRGMTFVKGRGLLPTYFVGIDEDYNFIPVGGTR